MRVRDVGVLYQQLEHVRAASLSPAERKRSTVPTHILVMGWGWDYRRLLAARRVEAPQAPDARRGDGTAGICDVSDVAGAIRARQEPDGLDAG